MSKIRLAALAKIFPSYVAIDGGDITSTSADVYPVERESVASAVESRQREFAAGRYFARNAMSQLDIAKAPIPVRSDRSPQWPAGVVGSISHAQGFCAAVVAHASEVVALGLDVESVTAVNPALWAQLFNTNEQAWLKRQQQFPQMLAASLLFSAKECFYKCQYNLTRQWLDFADVELRVGPQRQFSATLTRTIAPTFQKGFRLSGQFGVVDQLVVCGMHIDA